MRSLHSVPSAALQLGFTGALPFVAGALISLLPSGGLRDWGGVLLLDYSAIILSFMGGVHWGVAILRGDPTMEQLGKSMTPSLLVLVAVLIGGSPGLILLAAGFGALLYVDQLETAAGRLPDWYPSLRRPLSAIVITSLVIGAVVPSL